MALFDENTTIEPAPRPRMSRRTLAGVWALAVAMVVLLVITFLPTSYVIQRPGPVYNTLGTAQNADGEEVPLISVEGAETYPTDGSLDLLTVQVQGNREHTPSWFELAMAWFDPSRAVMPIDAIFPADQTTDERNEENAQMMVDSQHEATAAALTELGYDVGGTLSVYSVIDGAAAEGILEQGDLILEANGEELTDVSTLRSVINEGEGAPVELLIERDGEQQTVEVTPKETTDEAGKTTWILGVNLTTDYDFPIDVTIQLNNVGGPSAGMMFALGIIDTLTPGELNGGQQVAGTGTITADGEVGPIGGIRQKMWGALDAGAQWFLAPEANCDEVVGHIPGDLRVFSVEDLDDALAVLDAVSSDGDLDALPTCTLK
ncbi:PDZ domain-containing protein [Microbacterium sp. NPDC056057]|uniref:YlbL family protein n=1 Tax=Microbacterium sp. NPDC056057 TaxID=3345699 RepID=UPI0035E19C98